MRKAILELVRQSSEILDKQNQNNMIAWLEKQAEVESDDDIEAEEKDIRKAFNKIWDEKQGEQKPAWSEVDNFMYNKIKNLLTDISLAPESRNSLFDWFKSIKDRVQPKPKQGKRKPAWSKEDDDMITTIEGWLDTLCEYLNDSSSEYISYIESCINWLESLRLQNMWKPSDEQIEALGVATDICSIPEKQYNELNKLYYELKKLKGE